MKRKLCLTFICVLIFGMCVAITAFAADYLYSASVEGELSLHISPDESSYKITSIPACSKLELIDKEGTWGLVVFRKKSGWINLSFTRDTYLASAEATGNDSIKNVSTQSEENRVPLYNVPSVSEALGSEVKYSVPNGFVLKITRETASGWGLASMNGKYAWVQMKDTRDYKTASEDEASQFAIYYVYTLSQGGKGVELWQNAGGGNLCAVIPDCIKLTVREKKGNFAYVSYDGINGWVNLKYTTQTLANAQINAGEVVNAEYCVEPQNGEDSVSIMSVPSENPNDGGTAVETIKKGSVVYVLRATLGQWCLVNHNGVLGWVPPQNLVPYQKAQENAVSVLEKSYDGYASADSKKGMNLYSSFDGKESVATVPEGTKVRVIAHQNGFDYVYCDYASGWAASESISQTYESAIEKNQSDKKMYYITNQETLFKTIPVYSVLCNGEDIALISEGTYFEVVKTTTTGQRKWGLTKIGESWGWINLNHAEKTQSRIVRIINVVAVVVLVIAALVAIVFIVMFIKKKLSGRKSKKGDSGENENGKRLYNGDSGAEKEPSDVSGK